MMVGWWYTTRLFSGLQTVNDIEVGADAAIGQSDPSCGGVTANWPGLGSINAYFYSPGTLSNDCDRYHYWSLHQNGATFLFADGSVRFLTYAVRFRLRDLATIAGGETFIE